jgi:hypothetical protein
MSSLFLKEVRKRRTWSGFPFTAYMGVSSEGASSCTPARSALLGAAASPSMEAIPLGHHPGAVGPGLLGQEGQGEGAPALLQGHGRWGEALGEALHPEGGPDPPGLHLHGEVHPGAGLGGELGRGQAEPQHPGPLQAAPRQGQAKE